MHSLNSYETLLHRVFGFKNFRKGQLETIEALFDRGRVLCIQPTGHGKSLLYQLPACLLDGITLVVSPLLALMRDQITQLHARFSIPAASFNSDQTEEENDAAKTAVKEGKIRILFVSPEQLDHIDRFAFLSSLPISLFVVDEAHCISTWGHDFRPGYRQILHFIEALEQKNPALKVLALTATADERVENDIKRQLSSVKEPMHIIREEMDRPNIYLSAIHASSIAEKLLLCHMLLADLEGSGLIYASTRENTELVAEFLKNQGIAAIAYHAGLESEEKRRIQEAFLHNQYKIVAATTALGMGIDKADLRFIIHFDIPGSITAYYQEVGRSGRDGLKAQGILLYHPSDKKIQEHFIDAALPSSENFDVVFTTIKTAKEPPNLTAIKRATGLHPTRVTIILAELIEQHAVTKESLKGSQVYRACTDALLLDLSRYTNQYLVKTQELKKMISFAEDGILYRNNLKNREFDKKPSCQIPDSSDCFGTCRMATLREALGDRSPPPCNRCDNCLKNQIALSLSPTRLKQINQWLQERPVPISPSRIYRISAGYSILDGKLHSELFIHFMKQRMHVSDIDEKLLSLLKNQAGLFAQEYSIAAIVPLPSRTWKARDAVASALADHLGVPSLNTLLSWDAVPDSRQGELLNNDQRQHNVHERMKADPALSLPSGALLLLDDYIGSGATMKEAARAIRALQRRESETQQPLIPLTIAAIKWHLGKPGFV